MSYALRRFHKCVEDAILDSDEIRELPGNMAALFDVAALPPELQKPWTLSSSALFYNHQQLARAEHLPLWDTTERRWHFGVPGRDGERRNAAYVKGLHGILVKLPEFQFVKNLLLTRKDKEGAYAVHSKIKTVNVFDPMETLAQILHNVPGVRGDIRVAHERSGDANTQTINQTRKLVESLKGWGFAREVYESVLCSYHWVYSKALPDLLSIPGICVGLTMQDRYVPMVRRVVNAVCGFVNVEPFSVFEVPSFTLEPRYRKSRGGGTLTGCSVCSVVRKRNYVTLFIKEAPTEQEKETIKNIQDLASKGEVRPVAIERIKNNVTF